MKNDPSTIAKEGLRQSAIELVALYVLTTIGATLLFDMHWVWAALSAPLLMLAALAGVMLFVELLWILVLGLDRIGQACGLRKSPLA